MEEYLADEQAGFRKDQSTTQQILALRQWLKMLDGKNKKIYNCFIDFQKAFGTINQTVAWAVLKLYGVNQKLVRLLTYISNNSRSAVQMHEELEEWFKRSRGSRQ